MIRMSLEGVPADPARVVRRGLNYGQSAAGWLASNYLLEVDVDHFLRVVCVRLDSFREFVRVETDMGTALSKDPDLCAVHDLHLRRIDDLLSGNPALFTSVVEKWLLDEVVGDLFPTQISEPVALINSATRIERHGDRFTISGKALIPQASGPM
jgi:hypothetical protein